MTIKDRGNIKWSSMMLPFHVDELIIYSQKDKKIQKPILDNQFLEEMNYIISEAFANKKKVIIIYYKDNNFINYTGLIDKIDCYNHKILLNNDNQYNSLFLSNIVKIYYE